MKTKLFTLFLALVSCAGTMFASDTQVDGIWYNFDDEHLTAEVTYQGDAYDSSWDEYSGEVVIPASVTYNDKTYTVTSIGYWAFEGCSGLTSVTIPNSVTSIGIGTFSYCTGLTSVTIPNSVTSIGDYAFSKCSGLTSVTIPSSVTSIGEGAFRDCSGLTSPVYNAHVFAFMPTSYSGAYTIPDGIESIAGDAFYYCSGLTSVTIPNSVTSIGDLAFALCIGLTSVTIPNSVTSIGDVAFVSCTGLASVTIPNSITSIGNSAFEDCRGLTSVTIPNSVTSIGDRAFSYCNSLTSIDIPNSVTSIGGRAFYNCSGLISVTNYATTPQTIDSDVFYNVNKSTCVLNVPKESVSLYQAAEVWKEFTNIVGVDDYTINYVDKDSQALYNHVVTLYVPVAPTITGFKFLKWVVVNGDLEDGITIQAVYQADVPSSAPEVYTNPSNSAQKLIRNGNVYILTDDSRTYTLTGQQVK